MTRNLLRLAAATGFFAATPVAAEDRAGTLNEAIGDPADFTLSGTVRARIEALGNDFRRGSGRSHTILAVRSTLLAEYHARPLGIGVEIMDSRIYGADQGTPIGVNDVNALEPVQAYLDAKLGPVFGKDTQTSLRAGRFTMDLGNRRMVARNVFRNTTNAFTGLRFDVETSGKGRITGFYTLPVVRFPADRQALLDNAAALDRESFDLRFWGTYLAAPRFGGRHQLEVYVLGLKERDSRRSATRDRHLHTAGFRVHSSPAAGQADYEVEAAYQVGTISTDTTAAAARVDVAAWFVGARLGYQFKGRWQPRIVLEYDRASGDRRGGTYNRFDTLFGARRFDFGPTGIYGAFGRGNISSPGARLELTPNKRWDGFVGYRAAWLDSPTDSFAGTQVRDPAGMAGSFAGHQIEGRVRYWIVPQVLQIDAGAVFLRRGRFLRDAPGADGAGDPRYGYLALTATL